MSAEQQVHNIFAETHDHQNNEAKTDADDFVQPPSLPPVTNLYNAAQKVGGSVMPHAQMLLQAAAGGHQLAHNNQLHNRPAMNIFDAAEDAYVRHIADLHAGNHGAAATDVNIEYSQLAAAAHMHKQNGNSAAMESILPVPTLAPMYSKGMREQVPSAKWMKRYNELKQYKQVHGDCCVPQDSSDFKQLSSWVRTQKQQYRLLNEGKHCHISPARVELLNEIDFEWSGMKRDQFWKERCNELVIFHARNGHTRVPEKYPTAPQLHSWVCLQRRQLKLRKEGKKNKLTDERFKLLEALGMEYQIRNTATWMDRFEELKGKLLVLLVSELVARCFNFSSWSIVTLCCM